ncbi:MAG: agmatine deiminase family protein [Phycisphaeraceae bacterium]
MTRAFHMPAEWEPQEAVWLTRPHNAETWPGVLDHAVAQWEAFADALAEVVSVRVTQDHAIATNDSWVRDYGPLFVQERGAGSGERAMPDRLLAIDYRFNAWGRKYEPFDCDDAAGAAIAEAAGCTLQHREIVLEGGAIDVDGRGTLLTTEQCLLHPNRNTGLDRVAYERRFAEDLGITRTIWLPGGIEGDDTDGHVDDVARLLAPGLVACVHAPENHPDHEITSRNLAALNRSRDAAGRPLTVVELPAPEPCTFDYPADRFGPGGPATVPASYANFLISNGRVFVPTFAQPSDDIALRILDDAMPEHTVVPIRADVLVIGLGTLHCLSLQQPRLGAVGSMEKASRVEPQMNADERRPDLR